MDPALTFKIPNAYHFTGIRLTDPSPRRMKVVEFCREFGVSPRATACIIRFRWDRQISFLDLSASWTAQESPASSTYHDDSSSIDSESSIPASTSFAIERQAIRELFAKVLPANKVGSEDVWKAESDRFRAQAAHLPLTGEISLAWRINTDLLDFVECDTLKGRGIADLGEPLEVDIIKLQYDRRYKDRVDRILLYPTAEIHWMEPGGGGANSQPVYRRVERRILIDAAPGRAPDPFDGFAAIDFGNTNSMFACLRAGSNLPSDIRFVQCDQTGDADVSAVDRAIPSAVLLKKFRRAKRRDLIPEAECTIGEAALTERPGELLLGGKRLLADPRRGDGHRVILPSGEVEIPKDLPAELFLSKMLRAFYASELGFPKPISVTYPTTFSDTEIDRTREAVYKALRRSFFEETYLPHTDHNAPNALGVEQNLFAKQLDAWIPRKRMLDEATAAAFYFLYRDFIRGPGRLPAAYFEYPNGVNLLLYDCGGGTTDIALIHCRITPNRRVTAKAAERNSDKRPEKSADKNTRDSAASITWRVKIAVLGRTGHRDFGGDTITTATYKVLKTTLAEKLASTRGDTLDWPNIDDADVEAWMAANYGRAHEYVRTNWMHEEKDPDRPMRPIALSVEDRQLRQTTTLEFWRWAEKVKINLPAAELAERSGEDSQEDRAKHPLAPSPELVVLLKQLIRQAKPALSDDVIEDAIWLVTEDAQFLRERVDSLIQRDIDRTIAAANEMISSRLQEATRVPFENVAPAHDLPSDSVVHWLYVVGKASRYSAIRNKLAALQIRDLTLSPDRDEGESTLKRREPRSAVAGRMRFETEVLKTCVAGGAVLATLSDQIQPDIKIEYDHDLSRRLPFSIGIDMADGYRRLYSENQRYEDLSPEWVPVAEERRNQTTLWLLRQWPGQESVPEDAEGRGPWDKYMRFDFREPPVGPIKIEYGIDPRDTNSQATRRKTFIMTDTAGRRERVIGKEVAERIYVSPPQCGNL